MSKINIKMLSDSALAYFKKNIERITKMLQENETNDWIYNYFKEPIFVQKKYMINDFELSYNPNLAEKEEIIKNPTNVNRLEQKGKYVITVIDLAGNETKYTIRVVN